MTYSLNADCLQVKCRGGHQHLRIQGAYTKDSAVYVWDLARHVALHFARALRTCASDGEVADVSGYESVIVNDILASAGWSLEKAWHWRRKSHINVLESSAGHAILQTVADRERSVRFACDLDSRVAKCALAKGRSPSSSLQAVCNPGWCFGPT